TAAVHCRPQHRLIGGHRPAKKQPLGNIEFRLLNSREVVAPFHAHRCGSRAETMSQVNQRAMQDGSSTTEKTMGLISNSLGVGAGFILPGTNEEILSQISQLTRIRRLTITLSTVRSGTGRQPHQPGGCISPPA